MNIRFRQLRAFLAVIDSGSVSAAAVSLALTQSSVSKLVSGLELELGFPLFDRLGRRLQLTQQGRMFLVKARDAIQSLEGIRSAAEDIRDNQGKRLRISAIGTKSFGPLVPRALAEFVKIYPDFSISLETKFRIDIEDWVEQGHSDVGITLLPVGHAGLKALPLPKVSLLAIVPDAHPLADRESIGPSDLVDERLIMPAHSARVRVLVEADFLNAGHRFAPKCETSTDIASAQMAAHGVGITILDPFSVKSIPKGPYKVLKWKEKTKLTYGMIWQRNRSLLPHEEKLFELVCAASEDMLKANPY